MNLARLDWCTAARRPEFSTEQLRGVPPYGFDNPPNLLDGGRRGALSALTIVLTGSFHRKLAAARHSLIQR
jgi:hypothetical protein